jgi:predicted MFS family arabinose efflux permease
MSASDQETPRRTAEALPPLWTGNYLKVWTANFMMYFSFMLLMPLLPLYLSDTFQVDKHVIGLVLSGYTITALLIRPFSGFLVDSFPRKTVLLACYFLFFALFAGYLAAGTLLLFTVVRTLHGAPFGAATVSNSTVAIDVSDPARRAEGIGYYGLSNNLAIALPPTTAVSLYGITQNYRMLFLTALICAAVGFAIDCTLRLPQRQLLRPARKIALDRFFLLAGWREGITLGCFSFAYGILSTYLAIYGKEELDITGGTGLFFMILAIGLMTSRIVGGRALRKGLVVRNATAGVLVSLCGYLLFAAVHSPVGYYGAALIIGLGNGHMYPAFQTMFINLAPNSQRGTANSTLLTSWDIGLGIGVLLGGSLAEFFGYHTAFWMAWMVHLAGVALFFACTRRHFVRHRLR